MTTQKGRRDHYLPQGYLRGFVDPARENEDQPLWKLDIASKRWLPRSTKAVGFVNGMYDYAGEGPEIESLPSADDAFSELENEFPIVRQKLLSLKRKGFRTWTKHLDFLLRYMDMLRVRSPLYFDQREAAWKATSTWVVDEVIDSNKIKLKSMEGSPPPGAFIQNRTVSEMREEMQKCGAWLRELNWALRYTESVTEPFVISEAPFALEMQPGVSVEGALQHPDTLLYFPVCWQVCLFGSLRRFDSGTDKLDSRDMETARRKYTAGATEFLISPTRLDDITNFSGTQSAGA